MRYVTYDQISDLESKHDANAAMLQVKVHRIGTRTRVPAKLPQHIRVPYFRRKVILSWRGVSTHFPGTFSGPPPGILQALR